jgi:hypothetical protein
MRWYSAAVVNRRRGSFVLLKEGLQFVDFAPKGIDHSLRADINSIAGVPLMHRNRGTLAPGEVELNAEPVHIEVFRIKAVRKSVPKRGVKSRQGAASLRRAGVRRRLSRRGAYCRRLLRPASRNRSRRAGGRCSLGRCCATGASGDLAGCIRGNRRIPS